MKPTEHATVGKSRLHEMPPGSVVMSVDDFPGIPSDDVLMPITRCRDGLWRMRPSDSGFDDLNGPEWLVLYVPAPVPPAIGDTLTLAQLEALPAGAGVVDPFGTLWQVTVLSDGQRRWSPVTVGTTGSSKLADTYSTLTLVWLPPTDTTGGGE